MKTRLSFFVVLLLVVASAAAQRQPEHFSFESINATDMVNLSTGDFTYNIPIIHVPGAGGGFSLPISYHAGIRLEQEASWVGLGWSINPGLIARDIIGVPDEAQCDQDFTDSIKSPGNNGWAIDFIVTDKIWYDSDKGFGGQLSIGRSSEGNGFEIDGSFTGDEIDLERKYIEFGAKMAGLNMGAPWHAQVLDGLLKRAANIGTEYFSNGTYTTEIKHGLFKDEWKTYSDLTLSRIASGSLYSGGGELRSFTAPYQSMAAPFNNEMNLTKGTGKWLNMYLRPPKLILPGGGLKSVKYFKNKLNDREDFDFLSYWSCDVRNMHGLNLYLDDRGNEWPTGFPLYDVHFIEEDKDNRIEHPISLAYDNYTVMAGDIGGSITPYRMEITNVARNSFSEYSPINLFLFNDYEGKVGFKYINEPANSYTYHDCGEGVNMKNSSDGLSYDYELLLSRFQDDTTKLVENDRPELKDGLKNGQLHYGRHIEWWAGRIFKITNMAGYTYHFTLRVYESFEAHSKIKQTETEVVKSRPSYPNAWLLTAITGPDYVDENANSKIDDSDYGYWVKFEYGKTNKFQKRIPYTGTNYTINSIEDEIFSVSKRDQYYLRKIETNTHIAIFSLSMRDDDRGETTVVQGNKHTTVGFSLKLDDIYLFTKKDFKFLESNGLLVNNMNYYSTEDLASQKEALAKRQLKRYHFRYDYSLCKNADNSFSGDIEYSNSDLSTVFVSNINKNIGKLTLKGIGVFEKDDHKLIPDYLFNYYEESTKHNPNYAKEKFDGWGYYSSTGEKSTYSHFSTTKGDAWCLREITTPVGGKIKIEYESDSYSSVAGLGIRPTTLVVDQNNYNITEPDLRKSNKVRDPDNKNTLLNYFSEEGINNISCEGAVLYDGADQVILFNSIYRDGSNVYFDFAESDQSIKLITAIVNLPKDKAESHGGGIRTKAITLTNESGQTIKQEFKYNKFGTELSSGAVTSEPQYCRRNSNFYWGKKDQHYDYPNNNLVYSNVQIVNSDGTEQRYYFEAPDESNYVVDYNFMGEPEPFDYISTSNKANSVHFKVDINTSKVGRVNKVEKLNISEDITESIKFDYYEKEELSEINNMGRYTQGTIHASVQKHGYYSAVDNISGQTLTHNLIRTTKNYYSGNILKSKIIETPLITTTETNSDFNFITSIPQTITTKYNDEIIEQSKVLAMDKYPKLGSKYINISNANMLTQTAATLTKKNGNSIDAGIQTWKEDWNNYYKWNATNGWLEEGTEADPHPIWRKYKKYVWNGVLEPEGHYSTDFNNYASTGLIKTNWNTIVDETNPLRDKKWQKTSEITHYDHYSSPIEVTDINGDYAATKKDPENKHTVATAANAMHSQFVHCSFEYPPYTNNQGEGGAYVEASLVVHKDVHEVHTGEYCMTALANGSSSIFNVPKSEVDKWGISSENKIVLRASVWVYGASNAAHCQILGPGIASTATTFAAGDWIQVSRNFTVSTSDNISFRINNTNSSNFYFDDFRIAPLGSAVSAYTYDNAGNVTAILNNDNFATKYEYDNAGRLTETYVEKPTGFEKVSSHNYNYQRLLVSPVIGISKEHPLYGEPVTFTALQTFEGYTFMWDFGDGSPQVTGTEVTHTFLEAGRNVTDIYYVKLTISNGLGVTSASTRKVTVPYIQIHEILEECVIGGVDYTIGYTQSVCSPKSVKIVQKDSPTINDEVMELTECGTGGLVVIRMPSNAFATEALINLKIVDAGYGIEAVSKDLTYYRDDQASYCVEGEIIPQIVPKILNPVGGEVYHVGDDVTIQFEHLPGTSSIFLMRELASVATIATAVSATTGSVSWKIKESDITPNNTLHDNYYINIVNAANSEEIYAGSHSFVIKRPLQISSINGSSSFVLGDEISFNVSSTGGSGNITYAWKIRDKDGVTQESSSGSSSSFTSSLEIVGDLWVSCTATDNITGRVVSSNEMKYNVQHIISASNYNPKYGEEVTFTSRRIISGYTYKWNFGDATIKSGSSVKHTYAESNRVGTDAYWVSLEIENLEGQKVIRKIQIIVPYISVLINKECILGNAREYANFMTSVCSNKAFQWVNRTSGHSTDETHFTDCGQEPYDPFIVPYWWSDNDKVYLKIIDEDFNVYGISEDVVYFKEGSDQCTDGNIAPPDLTPEVVKPISGASFRLGDRVDIEYKNIDPTPCDILLGYMGEELGVVGTATSTNGSTYWTIKYNDLYKDNNGNVIYGPGYYLIFKKAGVDIVNSNDITINE